jgi:hypothetical protein
MGLFPVELINGSPAVPSLLNRATSVNTDNYKGVVLVSLANGLPKKLVKRFNRTGQRSKATPRRKSEGL